MDGAADFAKIYEDACLHKIAHCSLCFRSGKDARLTEPLMFKEAMRALRYNVPEKCAQQQFLIDKVCYICEARAGAVVRFLENVHLSIKLKITLHLAKYESKARRMKRFQHQLCRDNFVRLRRQTELTQTDVLLVEACDAGVPGGIATSKVINKRKSNVSNTALRGATSANKKSPRSTAGDYLLGKQNASARVVDKPPQMPIPISVLSPNNTDVGVTVGQDGFLNITGSVCKETAAPIKRRHEQYTKIAAKKSKVDETGLSIFIENPPSIQNSDVILICDDDIKIGLPNENVVKLPVRNNSNVNWEDKIPMEVISFGESEQPAAAPAPSMTSPASRSPRQSSTGSRSALRGNHRQPQTARLTL